MSVLLALLGLLAGLAVGLGLARWRARTEVAGAREEAAFILERAYDEVEAKRLAADRRATLEGERIAAELRQEIEHETAELAEYELELDERDALLDVRERALAGRAALVASDERAASEVARGAEGAAAVATSLEARRLSELESRSGTAAEQVRVQLVREVVQKAELATLLELRELEETLDESAANESRRVMQIVTERYDGASHLERVQNAVTIEEPRAFAVLADSAGRGRAAFLEEVGCDLVLDEAELAATVRGDDPLAREVARRVLRQLASMRDLDADKIRGLARRAKDEVDRESQNAGRKALRLLDVGRVHPEVLRLVGRLKFRLSYSQNQWRHAIEVGHLAGMMAEELGLDVRAARRGGLLHDIGKAMTHDHEGSHAVLGAEVARRCGEDEVIANAIGSHHNDEPPKTPLAYIVTAADAMSGGRPGARRESVTQYLNRIQDIQRIASRSAAVKRVDIMQAGREVRVVVAGAERGAIDASERHGGPSVNDADIQPLAQQIASSIEREMTYAGQIRVTVIRESRSVAVAH